MHKGIDASYVQGKIDWNKAKDDGVEFAFIRAGYGWDNDRQIDKQFVNNVIGCEEAGIPYGLVKPDVAVSTREAYAAIQPQQPAESLKEIIREPVSHWRDRMINDFEASVFPQFPQIQAIKEQLYTEGALYASMTGSGSSVFGLFAEETHLHDHPAFAHCFVWEGRL